MNLNKVYLVGRLTRDPQSKVLPSGQPISSFGLATDRFYVDKSNQKQQKTEFHNIVLFGKLADIASKYLFKGSLVLVEGRLQTRSWQDQSGNQRTRTEIVGESIQLGPKSASSSPRSSPPAEKEEEAKVAQEDIPIIEEEEINVKDIPF